MAIEVGERCVADGSHVVQFYDGDDDLVTAVVEYIGDAVEAGEVAIVIATAAHRLAFEAELAARGIDLAGARDEHRYVPLDAATTLAAFTRSGRIDETAFREVIGGLVHDAVAPGRPVRAYGEMVALLWEAGDVQSAIELETLWNELGCDFPFALFCAYPSELISGSEHADAFHQVCHLHSTVVPRAADPARNGHDHGGSGQTVLMRADFAREIAAPGTARRSTVQALRESGQGDALVEDAALVVSELATNAVVHARSAFSIAVTEQDSVVRISVHDRGPDLPLLVDRGRGAFSGRGLIIVNALATRWGIDPTATGKVVWAELDA
jgi:anti-sigma regulatory factor (Ser/Thr protein kinase)